MGIGLGGLAGLGSLASGIGGLFGAGAQAPPQFNMPGMGQAASSALSGIGGLGQYNLYAPNIGTAQNITSSLVNNPYAGAYQQGALTAGGMGQQAALNQYGLGGQLGAAGGAVLGTAFDPQSQLYNYTLAQTMAQQNAQNAAAGVGTTPYGAGLQDQNIAQFNMNWQNQQLARQLQGLQGAGGAYQTAAGLQGAAPQQYLTASAMPYSTYAGIGQGQLGALTGLGQFGQAASTLPQQQIQDYTSYLQTGNQAASVANQQAVTQAALQNMYMNQIGAGLSGLGNFYGSSPLTSTYGQLAASSPQYSGPYSYQGIFGSA